MNKKYNTVGERYLHDALFCRLTDWLFSHMKAENFNRLDFIDAINMAAALNYRDALCDGLITEKEYQNGISLLFSENSATIKSEK